MIERIAGCLEQRGRSLLRSPKKKLFRSRRYLHSAFWSHGASTINLPAWWVLLLQSPPSEENQPRKDRGPSTAGGIVLGLQGLFLDFLYPLQTRTLIRKLKRSANAHYQAAQSVKQCSRSYTSTATSLITNTGEGVNWLQREIEDHGSTGVEYDGKQARKRLHELLDEERTKTSCDALWQRYQDLSEQSEVLSSHELIRMLLCLRASKCSTDTERLLALFESIPIGERRAIHYNYAISAALELKDAQTAVYIQHEALSRLHSSVGTSAILRHAIMQNDWKLAIGTWQIFWNAGIGYYLQNDIWAGIEALPLSKQMEKAMNAADHAISEIESTGSRSPSAARDFAMELIKRAFQIKNIVFNVELWRQLHERLETFRGHDAALQTTALDIVSIEQALSLKPENFGSAALDEYCHLRHRDTNFVPSKQMLQSLLDRVVGSRKFTETMRIVVDDWRTYCGKLDVAVYVRMMKNVARNGDVDKVHELFKAYCTDHGKPQEDAVYHSLLQAHYRRADPEQAANVFDDLQRSHGFVPDVIGYNIIIRAFARVGDVEAVENWFEKLQMSGIKPDSNSYFSLMLVYSKRGDLDAVLETSQEATAAGLKRTLAMVDVLVLANVNDEKMVEAERLLEEALNMDLKGPRTHMWNIVLNAYALRKDLDQVTRLHRRMQKAGIPSDGMTYAALITSLSITKQPQLAYKVLKKLMPAVGVRPSVLHYATVMGGFFQTKEYGQVFLVYKDMLRHKFSPNLSTQNVLLRAAASVGETSVKEESDKEIDFTRARQVLDQTISNLDPSELTSTEPRKFVGPHRLDEAFTSTYFDYMIFLYGKAGAFDKVSEAYNQYLTTSHQFSQRDVESSPPMRMLSALLVAHKSAGNAEQIDQCWYLALHKCEILACKVSAKDLSQPNWVLPSRRFIINLPLQHYLGYLGDQSRFEDMVNVVNDLLRSGYDLTHHNWNTYIQYLTRSPTIPYKLLAFTLTESTLMPHWTGWEVMGRKPLDIKYRFRGRAKDALKDPAKRTPTYLTFVRLTAAYVELGFGRSRRRSEEAEKLESSGQVRRTLDAVRNLPFIDDWEQRTILNRGPYSDQEF
ncbi:MAG: hypothetical protein Q9164_000390 [Protoblastenia rupestris]